MEKNNNFEEQIPVNLRNFILSNSSNAEDFGWDEDDVIYILTCIQEGREDEIDFDDDELQNSIGIFFENGICTPTDINKAVAWYEKSAAQGNDLAKSNLADILRKGSDGYPKDLKRAFELYKTCGLPYAHYRCGEFYEKGWGTEVDLEKAKVYYRLAYKEGHELAKWKLKEWNFME